VLRLLGKVGGGLRISKDELLVRQEEHLKELKRVLGLPQDCMLASTKAHTSREVGIVGVKERLAMFPKLPQYRDAMIECRSIIGTSYSNLPRLLSVSICGMSLC
jgi:hypothetical protein